MMLLQLLLAAVAVAGDRVVVNRRARQRQRQVTTAPPDRELYSESDFNADFDRRFRVQNAFSLALANSDGFGAETIYGQNISSVAAVPVSPAQYELTTEAGVTQARVPRRRTQLARGRGQARSAEVRTEAPASSVTRSRARIPRRRINPNRDLERNERNTFSVERDKAAAVTSPRRLSNNIPDTADTGTGRSGIKSRSRSRFRSRGSAPPAPGTTARPSHTPASVRGRGRATSRARPRPEARDFSDSAPKKTTSRPLSAKVIFPRKDLFPKLNKYSLTQAANEVDTGRFVGSESYKLTKERLKSSLTKV